MLVTYNAENLRDFGPRYTETYGFLHVNGDPRKLVFISDNTEREVYFRITDGGMQYHALRDSGVQFEFIPVTHGFFRGASGNTYLLTRIPARHWKRGISHNNTTIAQLKPGGFVRTGVSMPTLTDIFVNGKGYSFPIDSEAVTPLSKHFAICSGDVYFYNTQIGTYDTKGGVITLDGKSQVQQELTDVIRRLGYANKVKVVMDV
jgi:hypothetical protein